MTKPSVHPQIRISWLQYILWIAFLSAGSTGLSAASQPAKEENPGPGPSWTEEQKDAQRESARGLMASIEADLAGGKSAIRIPPGDYRFDGTMAKDVRFTGLQDVTMDATGAQFWFAPRFGVRFDKCRNVKLVGLTIDSDPLPWTQGIIEDLDAKAETIVLRIDPGYSVPAGDQLKQRQRILYFDPTTARELPVYDDKVVEMEPLDEGRVKILRLDSQRVFRDPVPGRPVRIGDRVALMAGSGNGGNFSLKNCEAVTLDRVTSHGAAGFAFFETMGAGGNHYQSCKSVRRPSTNRLMASRADCFHSYLMEKGPVIENCEFSHSGDDLLAIHGFFGVILKAISPKEFLVATPFGRNFNMGSKLEFLSVEGNDTPRPASIVSMEESKDKALLDEAVALPKALQDDFKMRIRGMDGAVVFRVMLDRDIAAEKFDLVSGGDYCGQGAVVRNNFLHDGHVRGVLVKTQDLLVENNKIERTAHGGIVLEPEHYWLEGPFNRRIRILNNTLVGNGWSAFERNGMSASLAAIQVGSHFGKRLFPRTLSGGIHNREIEIRGNTITRPAGFGILVMNAAEANISDNTISEPFSAGPQPTFYHFAKLTVPAGEISEEDTKALAAPYYSIFLFETKDASMSGNASVDAPPFLKGTEGSVNSTRK